MGHSKWVVAASWGLEEAMGTKTKTEEKRQEQLMIFQQPSAGTAENVTNGSFNGQDQ